MSYDERVRIIVPDATPLITLAAADALDLLLKPNVPVLIPDGVHFETTRHMNKTGAQDIVEWLKSNLGDVVIAPTTEFAQAQILFENGAKRVAGMGERCAIEVVNEAGKTNSRAHSLLIYEDSDVPALTIVKPHLVSVLSTAEFLDGLQHAGMIPSADAILDRAVQGGRDESARTRGTVKKAYQNFLSKGGFGY